MANKSGTEIPISELNIPQLNQLSQQLEQEIELLQNSLGQLKTVQQKFTESQDSLGKITRDNVGKEILVPLTSSMYVPGELSDSEKVFVEIGTGYYVEKTVCDAGDYFKRKVDYLTKQMEKVQPLLQEKFKMKQGIMEILQLKVQAQLAAQQQQQQQMATAVAKS